MILRITVQDNGHYGLMNAFAEKIAAGKHNQTPVPNPGTGHAYDAWCTLWMEEEKKYAPILGKTYKETTKEERLYVEQVVNGTFAAYLNGRPEPPDVKDCLKQSFQCRAVASVPDLPQDAKVWYIVFSASVKPSRILNL